MVSIPFEEATLSTLPQHSIILKQTKESHGGHWLMAKTSHKPNFFHIFRTILRAINISFWPRKYPTKQFCNSSTPALPPQHEETPQSYLPRPEEGRDIFWVQSTLLTPQTILIRRRGGISYLSRAGYSRFLSHYFTQSNILIFKFHNMLKRTNILPCIQTVIFVSFFWPILHTFSKG